MKRNEKKWAAVLAAAALIATLALAACSSGTGGGAGTDDGGFSPPPPETYAVTIDGKPASLDAIRALSGGEHNIVVTGPIDREYGSNFETLGYPGHDIADAIRFLPAGTMVSLDLSATTGLTSISGGRADSDTTFFNCVSLTSITIPDSVTSISDNAFSGCTSLTSITIPASVTSIDGRAFDGCWSLTSVEFKNKEGWKTSDNGKDANVTDASTNVTNLQNTNSSDSDNWGYRGIRREATGA